MSVAIPEIKLDHVHKFRIRDELFLFHVPRFRVFKIDDFTGDVIDTIKNDADLDIVREKYPAENIDDLLGSLHQIGLVVDKNQVRNRLRPKLDPPRLTSLVLNISNACNLRCRYCSATQVSDKPQLMSREVAEHAVDLFLDRVEDGFVGFFGGEPLMNFDVLRHTVTYGQKQAARKGRKIRWSLTTNGTLVNDDVIAFLEEYRIPVVYSIDGYPEAHDRARQYADGRGSYRKVAENARRLLQADLPSIWARATISFHNLDVDRVAAHLHNLGFKYITTGFASLIDYSRNNPFSHTFGEKEEAAYREGMLNLAEYVARQAQTDNPLYVVDLGYYVNALHNMRPRQTACGAGKTMLAVAPDGRIYPCPRFDGMPVYELGDALEQISHPVPFDSDQPTRTDCDDCWARYLCGGGCWGDVLLTRDKAYKEMLCRLWRYKTEAAVWLYYKLSLMPEGVLEDYCRHTGDGPDEHLERL